MGAKSEEAKAEKVPHREWHQANQGRYLSSLQQKVTYMTTMTYGALFKMLRKHLGLSQYDFAERIGICQGALSKIEAGKAKPGLEPFLAAMRIVEIYLDDSMESHALFDYFNAAIWRGL